jgi:hypothetical protein
MVSALTGVEDAVEIKSNPNIDNEVTAFFRICRSAIMQDL